jgi:hypothetical protein
VRLIRPIRVALVALHVGCAGDSGSDSDAHETDIGLGADAGIVDVAILDASAPGAEDWVAFIRAETQVLERVVMARADGSGIEFELPVDGDLFVAKHPSFAPDGSAVVYTLATTEAASLQIFSLRDQTTTGHLTGQFGALQLPDWSPDGRQIAFRAKVASDAPWTTWIWTIESDTVEEVVPARTDPPVVSALAWSCDGTSFFHVRGTGGPGGQTDLWEMAVDGTGADQITFGKTPTNLLVRVRPDCHEVIIDSLTVGGPLRVGVSAPAPAGMLVRGFSARIGLPISDSNCTFAPGGGLMCERLSGPPPDHAQCELGGADCTLDIVSIDGRTGEGLSNATMTIDARETFPVTASVPGGFEP